jgi:hypothetical protein
MFRCFIRGCRVNYSPPIWGHMFAIRPLPSEPRDPEQAQQDEVPRAAVQKNQETTFNLDWQHV